MEEKSQKVRSTQFLALDNPTVAQLAHTQASDLTALVELATMSRSTSPPSAAVTKKTQNDNEWAATAAAAEEKMKPVEVDVLREGEGGHEWPDGSLYEGSWKVTVLCCSPPPPQHTSTHSWPPYSSTSFAHNVMPALCGVSSSFHSLCFKSSCSADSHNHQ